LPTKYAYEASKKKMEVAIGVEVEVGVELD